MLKLLAYSENISRIYISYLEFYKKKDAYIPWQCVVKYCITNFGKQIDLWLDITNYDLIARLIKIRYIFWSLIWSSILYYTNLLCKSINTA